MLALLKHNPFRTTGWRFKRILALMDQKGTKKSRASCKDDDYIKKFKRFLTAYKQCAETGDAGWQYLFPEIPGLYYAWLIHTESDDTFRCVVEARLLAGQSDAEIADEVCTIPEAIEWYAAIFFDVRDRLRHRDWIIKQVLGPSAAAGLEGRDLDFQAKMFGYFAGPVVLDVILHGFNGRTRTREKADVPNYLDTQMATCVRRKSAMASLTFEVNRYNVVELFMVHTKLIELERAHESGGGVRTEYELLIAKMTENLPFAVGTNAQRIMKDSALAPYVGLSAELRTEDLLRVAAGTADPDLLERTQALTLPPPRRITSEDSVAGE